MRSRRSSRRLIAALGGALLTLTGLATLAPSADAAFTQFSYTGPAVAIPDNDTSGINVTVAVSGMAAVTDAVAFRIDGGPCNANVGSTSAGIDHSFVGDLTLTLTSPAGTSVVLMNRPGGIGNSGNNFCQTVLDDTAATSIESLTSVDAPFTGTYMPDSPLAGFRGETANGTWKLQAQDFYQGDTGNIRAFSIAVTPAVCNAVPSDRIFFNGFQ